MRALPLQRCTVCGRPPLGRVAVSLHEELTCMSHPVAVRCVFCSRPDPVANPDRWRPFSRSTLRCPTCVTGAVETQLDARRMLPTIRGQLSGIGIALARRVRVRLVDADELGPPQPHTGAVLAVTESRNMPGKGRETTEIRVGAGLPPQHFGRAVAHEIGHAWLTEQSGPRPPHVVEEGLCELFSHAWLKQQQTPLAELMRHQMRENPDSVYGDGLRVVLAAVKAHGIRRVLDSLSGQGRLPP